MTAVAAKSLSELLTTLTDAVTSATSSFPSSTEEFAFTPSKDGISLLDVKNDLLLSYLQHLVFLILLKLRHGRNPSENVDDTALGNEVVKKLIELRVYLERGVRPLEGRLKYPIDKVLRAAEDADRTAVQKQQRPGVVNGTSKKRGKKMTKNGANVDSGSDASSFESGSEESEAESAEEDEDEEEEHFRPNALALARAAAEKDKTTRQQQSQSRSRFSTSDNAGAYKPPRITPTAMPTTDSTSSRSRSNREDQRRRKSNLVDEYIDTELSSAPTAQPSIGSNATILAHGRGGLSARDRAQQRERTEYEERNFTRLPAPSKKERRKQARESGRRDMYGGEDWTGLGGMGDRISRSVAGGGRDELGMLQRREKRKRERDQGRDTVDGPRGDGIGENFEKRRKVLQGRLDRKAAKKGGRRM